jgi:hypothetical protein
MCFFGSTKKKAWELQGGISNNSSSWTHKHVKLYNFKKLTTNVIWCQNGAHLSHIQLTFIKLTTTQT